LCTAFGTVLDTPDVSRRVCISRFRHVFMAYSLLMSRDDNYLREFQSLRTS